MVNLIEFAILWGLGGTLFLVHDVAQGPGVILENDKKNYWIIFNGT